jgi:3-phytase
MPMPAAHSPRFLPLCALVILIAACSETQTPVAPSDSAAPSAATDTGSPTNPDSTQSMAEPDENEEADPLLADSGLSYAAVAEAFVSASTPEDNVDSPAAWTAPDGSVWLLATAKGTHRLLVYSGDSGELLRAVGEQGAGPGQFDRPNGVFVIDDLALVVERDNRRVQVLRLPDFASLGSFGSEQLRQPYGLWLQRVDGGFEVSVSDAYMDASDEDAVPPLEQLGQRYQRYRVSVGADAISAEHLGSFGAQDAAGAIRIPESLWGDPAHGRLLLSEEDTADGTRIKVYGLDHTYAGRDLGAGLFRAQAEGIALYECVDGQGWWIATDQFKDRSLFHVFDRVNLEHRGSFAGTTVANTDGVWLHRAASSTFPEGAFYAVHDDQGVAAFDWRAVREALGLPRCETETRTENANTAVASNTKPRRLRRTPRAEAAIAGAPTLSSDQLLAARFAMAR